MISCSMFSSKNKLHKDEMECKTTVTLPKILVALLFTVNHNLSQFAQHFGEFTVGSHSGNVMKADDFFM